MALFRKRSLPARAAPRALHRAAIALLLIATAAAGGAALWNRPADSPTGAPDPPPLAAPDARPPLRSAKHVVVVVEENKTFERIVGSPEAPFHNWLAEHGTLLTRFYGVRHPSLPNYIAMIAGDTFGFTEDCTGCAVDAPSLADQLEAAGLGWKAYMQGLPEPCSDVSRAGDYRRKHNPFMFFRGIRDDPQRCASIVPYDQFAADLASDRLPQFAFVVGDIEHDMHDGSVAVGDAWLRDLYDRLTASSAWQDDTRLVVTFDEGKGEEGCCGGVAAGGRIATIVAGPGVAAGARDATPYSHYALLGAIESLFGLDRLGHAADAADIPAISQTGSR